MQHVFLAPVQLVQREEPPAAPSVGTMYYDTALQGPRIWDGAKWTDLSKLGAGRTVSLTGDVTGASADWDGSSDLSIETTVVKAGKRYTETIAATGTSIPIVHGLGTMDIVVQIYRLDDGSTVHCNVHRTSATTVTLTFAKAIAANEYRIVVLG